MREKFNGVCINWFAWRGIDAAVTSVMFYGLANIPSLVSTSTNAFTRLVMCDDFSPWGARGVLLKLNFPNTAA